MESIASYLSDSNSESEGEPESAATPIKKPRRFIDCCKDTLTSSVPRNSYGSGIGDLSPVGYVSRKRRDNPSVPTSASISKQTILSKYKGADISSIDRTGSDSNCCVPKRIVTRIVDHNKPVVSLQWHPIDHQLLLSASFDKTMKLWDTMNVNKPLATVSIHTEAVRVCQWQSATHTVSGGFDKKAAYTDMESLSPVVTFSHEGAVTALKISTIDANFFVTGDSTKSVTSWDLRTRKSISKYHGAGGQILDLEFLNNEKEIVASCDIVRKNTASQMVLVWEKSSTIVRSNQVYTEPYTCPSLCVHPWDKTFMAQSNGNYTVIFSTERPYKMNRYKRFEGHSVNGNPSQITVASDGNIVCSASACGKLFFYNYFTSRLIKTMTIPGPSTPSIAVSWHPSLPSTVACSSWTGSVYILN